jgi:hypothetical protein
MKAKIYITKNGKEIKSKTVNHTDYQKNFDEMFDFAGGLWNELDKIKVGSKKI